MWKCRIESVNVNGGKVGVAGRRSNEDLDDCSACLFWFLFLYLFIYLHPCEWLRRIVSARLRHMEIDSVSSSNPRNSADDHAKIDSDLPSASRPNLSLLTITGSLLFKLLSVVEAKLMSTSAIGINGRSPGPLPR